MFLDRPTTVLKERVKQVIYGSLQTSKPNENPPLTEKLSFILKHTESVTPDDVEKVINTPGYDILAPYFGLKLLDQEPLMQKQLLKDISNAFQTENGHEQGINVVRKFLQSSGLITSGVTLASVSPEKLSRIAVWGPDTVAKRAQAVIQQAKQERKTPIIVAYGGLVVLESAVKSIDPNETIIIVMPKRIDTDQKGFKITKSDDQILVDVLRQEDLAVNFQAALIDDTTHSGKTFAIIKQLFPNAQITNAPLFQT